MFSQKDFIEASRDFVCVRLESYENKEYHDMVRSFLNGRFENTAFCVLAPDGKTRLSGTGRSPNQGLGGRRGPRGNPGGKNDTIVIEAMERIAKKYRVKGDADEAVVQDFHTFRQGLNVASADQRLLLLVVAPQQSREELRRSLRPVMADEEVIGRFHVDFAAAKGDTQWADAVSGEKSKSGLFVIQSDAFGMEGQVLAQLPLEAENGEIKEALLKANTAYAKSEKRKVYSEHVSQGRREQVYFENEMPYGEDRDADGVIDHRGGRGGPPQGGPRRGPRGGPPRR